MKELNKQQIEVVNDFTKQMVKFWKKQCDNAYDCPSLDILFKDGSSLKFYIFVREFENLPFGGFTMAYTDYSNVAIEFPLFLPTFNKMKVETAINQMLTNISKQVDISKETDYVYENVLNN